MSLQQQHLETNGKNVTQAQNESIKPNSSASSVLLASSSSSSQANQIKSSTSGASMSGVGSSNKFSTININNQFKGKAIETQQKSTGKAIIILF